MNYPPIIAILYSSMHIDDKLKIIKILVENGYNVNEKNNDGNTAVMICINCHDVLRIAKFLVEQGANINEKNNEGNTAIIRAVEHGYTKLVKYFVELGADINLVSQIHYSPLMSACKRGNIEIVKYLLSKGAQVNKHNDISSPLIRAITGNIKILKIKIVKLLVNNGALVNEILSNKCTPLWTSIRNNHKVITKYLIRHGAYIKFGNYHLYHITDIKLIYIKKIILKRIKLFI